MKKHLLFVIFGWIILLNIPELYSQSSIKLDSLPPGFYGCWHFQDSINHPFITIENGTIEYENRRYYIKIAEKDVDYHVICNYRDDTLRFKLKQLSGDKILLDGGPFNDLILFDIWKIKGANKLKLENLPDKLFKRWRRKGSREGSSVIFWIDENGVATIGPTPYMPDEIMELNNEYRITIENRDITNYYFLKNHDRNYIEICNGTGPYKTYNIHYKLPDAKPESLDNIPEYFWDKWYSTNGSNELIVETNMDSCLIKETYMELVYNTSNDDTTDLILLSNQELFNVTITELSNDYLLWQWGKDNPRLLKSGRDLPDGHVIDNNNLPGWIFGYWYSTDGENNTILGFEYDNLKYDGKKIKGFEIIKNQDLYTLITHNKRNQLILNIKSEGFNYVQVQKDDDLPILLKRDKKADNSILISPMEIPEKYIRNWFESDHQNMYVSTISEDYFFLGNERYDYKTIQKKAGSITFNAINNTKIINVTVVDQKKGISLKINDNESRKLINKRNSAVIGDNIPNNKFPQFKYLQGGKTKLSGYILNHRKHPDFTNINVYISLILGLSQSTEGTKINSDGTFEFEFYLPYTIEGFGRFGESFFQLFISPNEKLTLIINADEFEHRNQNRPSIAFVGELAQENYLINDYKLIVNNYEGDYTNHRDHIRDDDSTGYKAYRMKLYEIRKEKMEKFLSNRSYSSFFEKWARNQTEYHLANDLMRYRWLSNSYKGIMSPYQIPVSESWLEWRMFSMDDPSACLNTDFTKILHEHHMYQDYATMLKFYPEFPRMSLPKDENGKEMSKSNFYISYINKVEAVYPDFVRDILVAKKLSTAIGRDDLDIIKQSAERFLDFVEFPMAKDYFKEKYDNLVKFTKEENDELEIKDLPESENKVKIDTTNFTIWQKLFFPHRGKVIYVDFWATWCGPCISQFPYSRMLKSHFKDESVVFMYLCGSSKKPAWKASIEEFKLKGDHHFLDDKEWREICKEFGVSGIPHYLLVDKSGKVVDRDAQRPQGIGGPNKSLADQIKKLLIMG